VAESVQSSLDDRFYVVASVRLKNRKIGKPPKDIDLMIISQTGIIRLVEIKSWKIPPTLNDTQLIREPDFNCYDNPIDDLKLYGDILRTRIRENEGLLFDTDSLLVLKNMNDSKINSKWKDHCLNLDGLLAYMEKLVRQPTIFEREDKIVEIIEKYICQKSTQKIFSGLEQSDFDLLNKSKEYREKLADDKYFDEVARTLHPKLWALSGDIVQKLKTTQLTLQPHLQKAEHLKTSNTGFVCFTLKNTDSYVYEPQLSFHVSTTDWYHKENLNAPFEHLAVKLLFIGNNKWHRQFLTNYAKNPDQILEKIRHRLAGRNYFLLSTMKRDTPFVLERVDDLEKKHLDLLYPIFRTQNEKVNDVKNLPF